MELMIHPHDNVINVGLAQVRICKKKKIFRMVVIYQENFAGYGVFLLENLMKLERGRHACIFKT